MYLQPFFSQNEVDLDAGIVNIQAKTLVFAQDRLAALWKIVSAAINKNAAAGQSTSATPGQTPPAPGAGLSLDSAMGLFRTFGPSLMSALQPAAAPAAQSATPGPAPTPSPAPSASTTSFESPAAEHRAAPPFPEPQLS
jgi:receptor expression-enhancing protein 1/2/3/4